MFLLLCYAAALNASCVLILVTCDYPLKKCLRVKVKASRWRYDDGKDDNKSDQLFYTHHSIIACILYGNMEYTLA